MLLSALSTCEIDVETHREVIDILIERSGINTSAKKVPVIIIASVRITNAKVRYMHSQHSQIVMLVKDFTVTVF